MKKRFISFFTALSMVLMMFAGVPIGVSAEEAGDLTNDGYHLDADGKLTIANDTGMTNWTNKNISEDLAESVKTVEIQDAVKSIKYSAFYGCSQLQSISISSNVESIGSSAFFNCSSLKSITIPDMVTSIGEYAFSGCTGLRTINIPVTLTSINRYTFQNCSSLESITIPRSVMTIAEDSAFSGCDSLRSINVDDSSSSFSSENGVLFNKDKTSLILYPSKKEGSEYAIPDTVASIENSAFYSCKGLTSVTIPSSVVSVGSGAFDSCSGLTSITIPSGVTAISDMAFMNCSNLGVIIYPNGATIGILAIPDTTTQVKYTAADGGKLNVAGITLGNNKTSLTVTDDMNIAFVAEGHRSNVAKTGHTHLYEDTSGAETNACVICNYVPIVHKHGICGVSGCTDTSHPAGHDTEITDWIAISNASGFNNLETGKHYYLTQSFQLNDEVTIGENLDITLCLNGQTLTAAENKGIFSIKGGSLTLCDCQGSGKLTGGNSTDNITYGGCVDIYPGTFTMYGGTITGNSSNKFGGGVRVNSQNDNVGTFIMYGGEISNNTAVDSGGGVYVQNGIFTMNGGTISNNTTTSDGGGVSIDTSGEFIINGGTISGNIAKNGGGVNLWGGKFTINGGTISGNTASNGGGGGVYFYSSSPFTMNDGTISGNTASGNGGGVCGFSYDPSPFIMNGGTISDNTASGNGGGVRYFKTMTLDGKVTITGNKSGTDDAKKDDNVYLPTNKTLTIGSSFSTDSRIGITTYAAPTCQAPVDITTTDNVSETTVDSFKADKEGQNIVFADGKLQFKGEHTFDATTGVCTACGNAGTLGNNVNWTYDENSKTFTISGEGVMTNWTNAASVPWADKKTNIEKVVIENGITSVGSYAFKDCTNLTDVSIPDSVHTIDVSAFDNTGLTKVTIPDSVNKIGDSAFAQCTDLKTVTFEGTTPPTTMGSNVFNSCTALDKIIVPEGAKNDYKSALTGLTDKVTDGTPDNECGENVTWTYDENSQTLTISGTGAMTDWSTTNDVPWADKKADIKNVVIEDGVTSVGGFAFKNFTNLESVTIPDAVTQIGVQAFEDCEGLKTVTFKGKTPPTIGSNVFNNCNNLEKIVVPENSVDAYKNVENLAYLKEIITADTGSAPDDDCTFDESTGKLTIATNEGLANWSNTISDKSKVTSVVIKDSVTEISNRAFYECRNLTKVTFEGTSRITTIPQACFKECFNLAEITIPSSVTTIGVSAFDQCSKLNLFVPDTVTQIDSAAFNLCKNIFYPSTISDSLKKGNGASVYTICTLDGSGNYELEIVTRDNSLTIELPETINGKKIVSTNYNAIDNKITHEGKHVSGADDKCAICGTALTITGDGWTFDEITGKLTITGGDTTAWRSEGLSAEKIKSVEIKSGVTVIKDGSFDSCSNLASVTIPGTVTDIESNAFNGCTSLDTIVYPSGATVGANAIPDTATQIKYTSESGNRNVTEITLGSGKTSVTITDAMGISSVAEDQRSKLSQTGHNHSYSGGVCLICGAAESGSGNTGGDDDNNGGNSGDSGNTDDSGNSGNSGNSVNSGNSGSSTANENASKDVQLGENVPKAELAATAEELISAVLAPEELAQLKDSDKISIVLEVVENVPAEDKQKVDSYLENGGHVLAQYMDVALYKIINDSKTQITSTNKPIRITFEVPEELRMENRSFAVLRVHGGETVLLPDLDNDKNTVTIETDRFSTYALVYSDKESASENGNPPTGIALSLIPFAAAAAFVTAANKFKKKG